jgi:hypothetical protein
MITRTFIVMLSNAPFYEFAVIYIKSIDFDQIFN